MIFLVLLYVEFTSNPQECQTCLTHFCALIQNMCLTLAYSGISSVDTRTRISGEEEGSIWRITFPAVLSSAAGDHSIQLMAKGSPGVFSRLWSTIRRSREVSVLMDEIEIETLIGNGHFRSMLWIESWFVTITLGPGSAQSRKRFGTGADSGTRTNPSPRSGHFWFRWSITVQVPINVSPDDLIQFLFFVPNGAPAKFWFTVADVGGLEDLHCEYLG